MDQTFSAPVIDGKVEVSFPDICICCGQAAETVSTLRMSHETTIKKKRSEQKVVRYITLDVPHCLRCQRQNTRNDTMSWVTFFIGAVPAAAGAFILYSLFFDWLFDVVGVMGSPNLEMDTGTVVILLSLVSAVPGGLLVESIVRLLFIPFFGRSLFYAPPLFMQIFGSQEYIAGLTARLAGDASSAALKLHNPQAARAFREHHRPAQTISTT